MSLVGQAYLCACAKKVAYGRRRHCPDSNSVAGRASQEQPSASEILISFHCWRWMLSAELVWEYRISSSSESTRVSISSTVQLFGYLPFRLSCSVFISTAPSHAHRTLWRFKSTVSHIHTFPFFCLPLVTCHSQTWFHHRQTQPGRLPLCISTTPTFPNPDTFSPVTLVPFLSTLLRRLSVLLIERWTSSGHSSILSSSKLS